MRQHWSTGRSHLLGGYKGDSSATIPAFCRSSSVFCLKLPCVPTHTWNNRSKSACGISGSFHGNDVTKAGSDTNPS